MSPSPYWIASLTHEPSKKDDFFAGTCSSSYLLANIQVDEAWAASDVAEVSVGHLSWAIDDAAHDGDGDAWQVASAHPDLLSDLLEVEEGAPAAGAGHILCLCVPHAGALPHTPPLFNTLLRLPGSNYLQLAGDRIMPHAWHKSIP